MSNRGRGSDGQDDVDAAFAAIVADLEREGFGQDGDEETTLDLGRAPGWDPGADTGRDPGRDVGRDLGLETGQLPGDPRRESSRDPGGEPGRGAGPGAEARRQDGPEADRGGQDQPEVWRGSSVDWDWEYASDTEHYVPPEPPPMPRLRAGTIAAIAMLVLGGLLLVVPQLIGIPARIGTPIALVALATGLGLLVLRMRSGPPPDTGWDDGAQI